MAVSFAQQQSNNCRFEVLDLALPRVPELEEFCWDDLTSLV
jgi:hypothetical protein